MPSSIERFNILLSCPGDVSKLVPTVFDALADFNEHYGDSHQIELHGRHWSHDMYPKSGGKPQDLINEVVLPNCDAAIAIFWCNLGTPTDKYESGTVEEIEQMLDMGRQVFLYFSKENPPYEVAEKGIDPRIADFKERYKDKGVYSEFRTTDELSVLLSTHLRLHFIDQHDKGQSSSFASDARVPQPRIVGVVDGRVSSVAVLHETFTSPCRRDPDAIREEMRQLLASAVKRYVENHDATYRPETLKTQLASSDVGVVGLAGASAKLDNRLLNIRPGSRVSIDENVKKSIQMLAKKSGIVLPEGFLSFIGLTCLSMPFNGTQYYGPEEEERRYHDINKIDDMMTEVCLWRSTEAAYGGLSNVVLALENAGTAPDEDIDVYLFLPSEAVILPKDIPRQDDCWLSLLEDEVGLSRYFAPKTGIRLLEYSDDRLPSWNPARNRYDYNASALEEFFDCFPYDFEEDGGTTTIGIRFSQIKQHTAIAFPTPIFLRKPIDTISYEIVSRGVGNVVRGAIDVKGADY